MHVFDSRQDFADLCHVLYLDGTLFECVGQLVLQDIGMVDKGAGGIKYRFILAFAVQVHYVNEQVVWIGGGSHTTPYMLRFLKKKDYDLYF